jgi:PilZ domain
MIFIGRVMYSFRIACEGKAVAHKLATLPVEFLSGPIMAKEKRRSDRILLTIPLSVQGTDEKGQPFQVEARTSFLNRHGGCIHVNRRLRAGEIVRIVNLVGRRSSDFRVVGPVSPFSESGGEYGVEYLDPQENIWGIQFPPLRAGETADSNALLECRNCHQVKLLSLSLVEVEVLQTSGILRKPCEHCGASVPWSYTEKRLAMSVPEGPGTQTEKNAPAGDARGMDRRRYRRVSLHLPVRVRDYGGGIEITRSENISKGGLCFISDKTYQTGEGIMVTCPYNSTGESIEVRARVASSREIKGNLRKIYGVQFTEREG